MELTYRRSRQDQVKMKALLRICFMLVTFSANLRAADQLRLRGGGGLAPLGTSGAEVSFAADYSESTVDGRGTLKIYSEGGVVTPFVMSLPENEVVVAVRPAFIQSVGDVIEVEWQSGARTFGLSLFGLNRSGKIEEILRDGGTDGYTLAALDSNGGLGVVVFDRDPKSDEFIARVYRPTAAGVFGKPTIIRSKERLFLRVTNR